MTDRVFEDDRNFEVSGVGGCSVEVYVFAGKDVMITATEDAGWDSQLVSFTMTAEEATMLKEFLIRKGY
jgi:putative lipase involved disintegration of autophagic bodies